VRNRVARFWPFWIKKIEDIDEDIERAVDIGEIETVRESENERV